MTKQEKQKWIIEYLKVHKYVDIFDEDFVDSYIQECKPNCIEYKKIWCTFCVRTKQILS